MSGRTGELKLAGRLVVDRRAWTTEQHVAGARGCHRPWSAIGRGQSVGVAGHRPRSVTRSGLLDDVLRSLFLLAFSSRVDNYFSAASPLFLSLHLVARVVFLGVVLSMMSSQEERYFSPGRATEGKSASCCER